MDERERWMAEPEVSMTKRAKRHMLKEVELARRENDLFEKPHQNTTTEHPQPGSNLTKQACLLGLPAELRLHIYRAVIEEAEHFVSDRRACVTNDDPPVIEYGRPLLAAVCTLVRDELLPLFYKEGTFIISLNRSLKQTQAMLNAWEKSLGEDAENLRNLVLHKRLHGGIREHPSRSDFPALKDPLFKINATVSPQGSFTMDCSLLWNAPHKACKHRTKRIRPVAAFLGLWLIIVRAFAA
ncbi:hypothetical protein LTR17_010684 [Elasticomyces elasticus]|nr:hypothetical protein LTR17_010684 [Elasticomyces elasticus]